jgi:hypothetical protein
LALGDNLLSDFIYLLIYLRQKINNQISATIKPGPRRRLISYKGSGGGGILGAKAFVRTPNGIQMSVPTIDSSFYRPGPFRQA